MDGPFLLDILGTVCPLIFLMCVRNMVLIYYAQEVMMMNVWRLNDDNKKKRQQWNTQ